MVMFTTRILREMSKDRKSILDAGCGTGTDACFLAKQNPDSHVFGYDINSECIEVANGVKSKHRIPNVMFSVDSHDTYEPPHRMDMIYTAGSLIGNEVLRAYRPDPSDKLIAAKTLVTGRLSAFRESLLPNGLYICSWPGDTQANNNFAEIAESCGLKCLGIREGHVIGYTQDSIPKPIYETALIFMRA